MTELLDGSVEVRGADPATPEALRTEAGWRRVERIVTRWVVDTDWWRRPIRRECCEVYRDLDAGGWSWSRRYD